MSGTPAHHGRQHLDLLTHDRRREQSVLWRLVLAGVVTTAVAVARAWWWV
ncbi:hypothetical protein [Pseudactinotalea suaedae]|nr:hypothetical protein [Pseudactinotalea suaedae]